MPLPSASNANNVSSLKAFFEQKRDENLPFLRSPGQRTPSSEEQHRKSASQATTTVPARVSDQFTNESSGEPHVPVQQGFQDLRHSVSVTTDSHAAGHTMSTAVEKVKQSLPKQLDDPAQLLPASANLGKQGSTISLVKDNAIVPGQNMKHSTPQKQAQGQPSIRSRVVARSPTTRAASSQNTPRVKAAREMTNNKSEQIPSRTPNRKVDKKPETKAINKEQRTVLQKRKESLVKARSTPNNVEIDGTRSTAAKFSKVRKAERPADPVTPASKERVKNNYARPTSSSSARAATPTPRTASPSSMRRLGSSSKDTSPLMKFSGTRSRITNTRNAAAPAGQLRSDLNGFQINARNDINDNHSA